MTGRGRELWDRFEADMAEIQRRYAEVRARAESRAEDIAPDAMPESLPPARVVLPWWHRLLLWFVEPPAVTARALPQPADDVSPRDVPGSAPAEVTPAEPWPP